MVVVESAEDAEIERVVVVVVGDAARASIVGGGMKAEIAVVAVGGGPTSGYAGDSHRVRSGELVG